MYNGGRVKELRKKNGLTQRNLAELMKVKRTTVNAWESGIMTPGVERIIELSEILSVSTDFILGKSEEVELDISDLNDNEIGTLYALVCHFRSKKREKEII